MGTRIARLVRRLAFAAINRLMRMAGYELTSSKTKEGYIDAAETIRAASLQGQTVCEYVESLWDQHGWTDRVIEEMQKAGSLTPCDRVCEIGPGTGCCLERVLQRVSPRQYDIYETGDDWATWLAETYTPPAVRQPADGHTLQQTLDRSCGLIHAHGVFVYLPFLHAFEYLQRWPGYARRAATWSLTSILTSTSTPT